MRAYSLRSGVVITRGLCANPAQQCQNSYIHTLSSPVPSERPCAQSPPPPSDAPPKCAAPRLATGAAGVSGHVRTALKLASRRSGGEGGLPCQHAALYMQQTARATAARGECRAHMVGTNESMPRPTGRMVACHRTVPLCRGLRCATRAGTASRLRQAGLQAGLPSTGRTAAQLSPPPFNVPSCMPWQPPHLAKSADNADSTLPVQAPSTAGMHLA
jgi:hypothetical protein